MNFGLKIHANFVNFWKNLGKFTEFKGAKMFSQPLPLSVIIGTLIAIGAAFLLLFGFVKMKDKR